MKIPKGALIEKAASKDLTRPILCAAYLNVEEKVLVATDTHVCIKLPVEVDEGDVTGLVSVEAIQAARKLAGKKGDVHVFCNGNLRLQDERTFPRPEGQFPQYERVIPDPAPKDIAITVCLDAALLANLAAAAGTNSIRLTITHHYESTDYRGRKRTEPKPILVTSNDKESPEGIVGVLMPMRDLRNE